MKKIKFEQQKNQIINIFNDVINNLNEKRQTLFKMKVE